MNTTVKRLINDTARSRSRLIRDDLLRAIDVPTTSVQIRLPLTLLRTFQAESARLGWVDSTALVRRVIDLVAQGELSITP